MESTQKKTKKKKDKKPLFILLGFLIFFGIFVYLITIPSQQSIALKELQTSFNKKDVEMVWYKYKSNLYQDKNFLLEIRKKLTSFDLTEEETKECISWLPPAPASINLIVVPDLSARITDTINNPKQIANDILILKTIWKSFVTYSKLRQDTKDNLTIDVTDFNQAKGQFSQVANDLQFDLSNHKGKSNRLFFTNDLDTQFLKSITKMYNLAKDKPLGANYRNYISQYLNTRLKKSDLFNVYKNKVIFITDGYLEYQNSLKNNKITSDTRISGFEKLLYPTIPLGTTKNVITSNNLNIPIVNNINISEVEFLVCEVNEREKGRNYHFPILKAYWEDWFERMKVKKPIFLQREQANNITVKKIEQFISQ